MRTIALRFGENIAPACGTIAAHEAIINELGYVWYGKMGASVSDRVIHDIMTADNPQILLIRSGKAERYWAKVEAIQHTVPEAFGIPEYYRGMANKFKTWFKVKSFVIAERNIMARCRVASSGNILGEASKHSMSPYFIIDYDGMESK